MPRLRGQKLGNKGLLSNYCGPGGEGPTRHPTDALCKEHDDEYGQYAEEGLAPYTNFNKADETLIEKLDERYNEGGLQRDEATINRMASTYFKGKRKVTPAFGDKGRLRGAVMPQHRRIRAQDDEDEPMTDETGQIVERQQDQVPPEDGGGPDEPANVAAAAGAGPIANAHETPILPATPSYGLQDTHTAVCPFNAYFTIYKNTNQYNGSQSMIISLVDPLMPLKTPISHVAVSAAAAGVTNGIYDRMFELPNATGFLANSKGTYPNQPSTNIELNVPEWWIFWSSLYKSYTVERCEYELTMHNAGYRVLNDAMVIYGIETSSASDNSDLFPAAYTGDMLSWPKLKHRIVPGTADVAGQNYEDYEVISGTYRPYQEEHLVQNDQDTKRWYKRIEHPALQENLHLFAVPAPLANGDTSIRLHCALRLRFIIQFKNRIQQVKYPYLDQPQAAFSFPAANMQPHAAP